MNPKKTSVFPFKRNLISSLTAHCMTVQNTAARLPKDLDLTGIRHCVLSWKEQELTPLP